MMSESAKVNAKRKFVQQPTPPLDKVDELAELATAAANKAERERRAQMHLMAYSQLDHFVLNLCDGDAAEFQQRFLLPRIDALVRENHQVWVVASSSRPDFRAKIRVAIDKTDDVADLDDNADGGGDADTDERTLRDAKYSMYRELAYRDRFAFIFYYPRTAQIKLDYPQRAEILMVEPNIGRRVLLDCHYAALKHDFVPPLAFRTLADIVNPRTTGDTFQERLSAKTRAMANWYERCFDVRLIYRMARENGLHYGQLGTAAAAVDKEVLVIDESSSESLSDNTMRAYLAKERAAAIGDQLEVSESSSETLMQRTRDMVDALADGHKRGITETNEFYDRLFAPDASAVLAGKFADVVANACELFHNVSRFAIDSSMRQMDQFYLAELQGLAAHQPEGSSIKLAAVKIVQMMQDKLERASVLANHKVLDAPALLSAAQNSRALMVREHVAALFRDNDICSLLAVCQDRNGTVWRHKRALLVPSQLVPMARLDHFLENNALVYQRWRANQILARYRAEKREPVVLRVLINSVRQRKRADSSVVAEQIEGLKSIDTVWEQRLANKTRPLSVLAALRTLVPGAKDGQDYLICWTPNSYNVTLSAKEVAEQQEKRQRGEIVQHAARRGRPRGVPAGDKAPVVSLSEPAIYVLANDTIVRRIGASMPALVLEQRATGRAELNTHMPLMAPLVARQMASGEDVVASCNSLNALAGFLGLSVTQWRANTKKAELFAVRVARVVARLTDYWLKTEVRAEDLATAAFVAVVDPDVARRDRMTDTFREEVCNGIVRQTQRFATIKQRSLLDALVVLADGNVMPVLCSAEGFQFLNDVVGADIDRRAQANRASVTAGELRLSAWLAVCREKHTIRLSEPHWTANFTSEVRQSDREPAPADQQQEDADVFEQDIVREFVDRRTAEEVRLDEVAQAARDGIAKAYACAVCVCGATTGRDCLMMARARTTGRMFEHLCCLCRPNFAAGYIAKGDGRFRFAADICATCRPRVPISRKDRDENALPDNAELFWRNPFTPNTTLRQKYEEYEHTMPMPFTELAELLLTYAEARMDDKVVVDGVREVLGSLGFRIRWWRSAPVHAVSLMRKRDDKANQQSLFVAAERMLVERYTAEQIAVSDLAPNRCLLWLQENMTKLTGHHREVLRATTHLVGTAHNDGGGQRATSYDSLAYVLSILESVSLLGSRALYGGRQFWGLPDYRPETREAYRLCVRSYYMPLRTPAQLRAYERAYDTSCVGVGKECLEYFPLIESMFGDVSVLGGVGFASNMSDWRQDWTSKVKNMLTADFEPRPLTGALPLLTELAFLNYYESRCTAE